MGEKSFLGELVFDLYPHSKTDAIYDLLLLVVVIIISNHLFSDHSYPAMETIIILSLIAGIKYNRRRSLWGQGGCFGYLVRVLLLFPLGLAYLPFLIWFAIRKLMGKAAPNV